MDAHRRLLPGSVLVVAFGLIGCGPGGAVPSGLGGFLEALASSIPDSSMAPQGDAPGEPPATIAGTLTIQLDEDQGDASSGLSKHTTFVANLKLKRDPDTSPDDLRYGLAQYLDDGSTWTYTGEEHIWSEGGASGCPSDELTQWDDSGAFTGSRYVNAATQGEGDFDWNLHLELSVDDAHQNHTYTLCGDTETGEVDAGGGGTFCDALWDATYVFDFNDNCDVRGLNGLTDLQGTLEGTQ